MYIPTIYLVGVPDATESQTACSKARALPARTAGPGGLAQLANLAASHQL